MTKPHVDLVERKGFEAAHRAQGRTLEHVVVKRGLKGDSFFGVVGPGFALQFADAPNYRGQRQLQCGAQALQ